MPAVRKEEIKKNKIKRQMPENVAKVKVSGVEIASYKASYFFWGGDTPTNYLKTREIENHCERC